MKMILFLSFLFMTAISTFAQNDVTTFLGIPVDGFKSEMKKKLIAKGFTPKKVGSEEFLEGEFNGTEVRVFIVTNNNKVYRIALSDVATQNATDIRIRFNRLVRQFENNKRYVSLDNYTLPDDEDIAFEMSVHDKIYEAVFCQVSNTPEEDSETWAEKTAKKPVWFRIHRRYGNYYITMYYDNEYNLANGEDL